MNELPNQRHCSFCGEALYGHTWVDEKYRPHAAWACRRHGPMIPTLERVRWRANLNREASTTPETAMI